MYYVTIVLLYVFKLKIFDVNYYIVFMALGKKYTGKVQEKSPEMRTKRLEKKYNTRMLEKN